jgi:hypothetical protein
MSPAECVICPNCRAEQALDLYRSPERRPLFCFDCHHTWEASPAHTNHLVNPVVPRGPNQFGQRIDLVIHQAVMEDLQRDEAIAAALLTLVPSPKPTPA